MSERPATPSAAALRAEFDASFATAHAPARRDQVALVVLRAGGEPVAVRVLEIAGLLPARAIVPVPSARPELLGVCGLRGGILPVFGLARLLRRPDDPGAPRWMVLAGSGPRRVALASAALDGHLVVAASELQRAAPSDARAAAHVAEVVPRGGRLLHVVSVGSLLRAITGWTESEHG